MPERIESYSVENRKLIGTAILEGLLSPTGFRFTEGGDYDQGDGGYTQSGGGSHDQGIGDYNQSAVIRNDFLDVAQISEVLKRRIR